MSNAPGEHVSTHGIARLKGPSQGRSAGSIYGDLVWTAAIPNNRNEVDDLLLQAKDLFAKIEAQLEAMGSNKDNIASATVWLADIRQKPVFDKAWIDWIGPDKRAWPQRVCIGAIIPGGTLVEIAVVGVRARS